MENLYFWDYSVWGWVILFSVLLGSLLAANIIKKTIPFLRDSLVPTSVLGGCIILIIAAIYRAVSGVALFEAAVFGGKGYSTLEVVTYHALALGFIASSFKSTNTKLTKQRSGEIFNTGVTTVSTYLLQALCGFGITMIAAYFIKGFFAAAGMLLPFGYGQGTGQALNYGNIYEQDFGFVGGKSFGLTIAAIGVLSASIGGVIHLNIIKKRGRLVVSDRRDGSLHSEKVETINEIPMQESMDKMTVQISLILVAYIAAYFIMFGLGKILPGMKSVIYGFNFLLGVLTATLIKIGINFLRIKKIIRKKYVNNFLMTRASNFFFDLMVVAGVAAIRLDILENYWGIMLILGGVGALATFVYNRFIAKKLFPDYAEEQFLMMYGMLTGTASTGVILLREVDSEFQTPASDNMVYQNFPSIVFGFPMMFLATLAPVKPVFTYIIFAVFFIALNIILFRKRIFRKRKK